jgi:hypothetical protein
LKLRVPRSVALERRAVTMEGIPVELDHDPGSEVDLDPGDRDVDRGRRKSGLAAQAQEAAQLTRAAVAEKGALASRQDRGRPGRLASEGPSGHEVDPA